MSRALCLVAALALAGPVCFASSARATFPGENGRIVFSGYVPGGMAISVINPDGSEPEQLISFSSGIVDTPQWSPDGSKIAFTYWRRTTSGSYSDGDIMLMDADGTNLVALTRNRQEERSNTWSPDGRRLAFVHAVRKIRQIFVMHINSPTRARQISDLNEDARFISWSPDGKRIGFVTPKENEGPDQLGVSDIYSIRPDGTGLRRITHGAQAGQFSWSPDSKKIVFGDFRYSSNPGCGPLVLTYGPCNVEIHVVDADGDNERRLTDNPRVDFMPAWSPDGSKIVFVSDRSRLPLYTELFVMNPDGSDQQQITRHINTCCADYSPDWQPIP